ncbi:MAG: aminoglycoside phosphotransferase family protein [Leifsonia sp.]|uniref:aminoglycoside phosphotransferase family protein n=1 Tax=Leifsonia sp. TaxID=1870902 RepID=UPI003F81ECB2
MTLPAAQDALDTVRCLARIDGPLRVGTALTGGSSNAVFEVLGGDEPLCLKLYRPGRADGYARETSMLAFLSAALPGRIPRLVAAAPTVPAVLLSRLSGAPLSPPDVPELAGAAVIRVLEDLYAIDSARRELREVPWPPPRMHERVASMIAEAFGADAAASWRQAAGRLGVTALLSAGRGRACVGRGDPALDNILWDGTTARLVDFESAGRSDVAHEIAEFLEHPRQRALPPGFRHELVRALVPREDRPALAASRWLLRSFWTVRSPDGGSAEPLRGLLGLRSLDRLPEG